MIGSALDRLNIRKIKDAEGHEHDDMGLFTSGSGGHGKAPSEDDGIKATHDNNRSTYSMNGGKLELKIQVDNGIRTIVDSKLYLANLMDISAIMERALNDGPLIIPQKIVPIVSAAIPSDVNAKLLQNGDYQIQRKDPNEKPPKPKLPSNVKQVSIVDIDIDQIPDPSLRETVMNLSDKQAKTLRSREKKIFDGMTEREENIARMYTGDFTYKATEAYNLGKKQPKGNENAGRIITGILDKAISKSKIEPGTHLWKGINLNVTDLSDHCITPGKTFSYKNFNSVTATLSVANDYAKLDKTWHETDKNAKKAIIEIQFPRGGKGLLISGDHSHNEMNGDAVINEVILPRNQAFKVVSCKETPLGTKIIWEAISQ